MESTELKEKFVELRAKGYSFDRIAKELGKAKQTLIDWNKELQDEIANLKALEMEALYEKYYLFKENRLQTFGQLLSKLNKEALNRNLSDVPTDKLLDLLLKYNNLIKEEILEPVYKTSQQIKEERIDREILDELTNIQLSQPARRLKAG